MKALIHLYSCVLRPVRHAELDDVLTLIIFFVIF